MAWTVVMGLKRNLRDDEMWALLSTTGGPDTWEVGIQKMREYIDTDTKTVVTRSHLFMKMQQGNMDIPKWGIELKKEAKQMDWTTYDWKMACLDALVFQMDSHQ